MNRIVTGKTLSAMLALPLLLGYVGQLVSASQSAMPDSPIFGERVAKFASCDERPLSEDASWTFLNGTRSFVSSSPRLPLVERGSGTIEAKFYLHLYRCTPGAELESQTDDYCVATTLPKTTKQSLLHKLNGDSANYPSFGRKRPLSTIPEDAPDVSDPEADATQDPGDGDPEAKLEDVPEELEGEDNEEPDEDDDDLNQPPGPLDFEPTPDQKRDLKIAHDNSGHPGNQDFARLLRRGNCRPEIARWVRHHFKCPECEANQRPRA